MRTPQSAWLVPVINDHVLDEVTMAGGVDDGDVVLGSLELPQGNVDGDATLALGLELVEHPGILEGALAHLQEKVRPSISISCYFMSHCTTWVGSTSTVCTCSAGKSKNISFHVYSEKHE